MQIYMSYIGMGRLQAPRKGLALTQRTLQQPSEMVLIGTVHLTDEKTEAQKSSKVTQLIGGRAGGGIPATKVPPTNVTTSHNAEWISRVW